VQFEPIRISEYDLCERGTAAGVMDDIFDKATNVAMSLGIVEGSELCRRFIESSVGR
jgi:hypothetical protein